MNEWKNNMYRFRGVGREKNHLEWLPSSALNYGGIYFEELIKGYQTLSVSGREMLSLDTETTSLNVGSYIHKTTLPSRTLKVTFKLTADDSQDCQSKFDLIMAHLYKNEDVQIIFNDDPHYFFLGRYVTASEIDGKSNSVISSFELLCSDPRKYSVWEYETNGDITNHFFYDTLPDVIEVVLTKNNSVKVMNGSQTVSITNSAIRIGDKVEFRFKEGKVLVNGVDKTNILDLTSDFKNFFLKSNSKITTDNGNLIIKYRMMML